MTRHFNQDPTEFFTVVGAPYIREHHRHEALGSQTDDQRPRRFEIVASVFAAFCTVALGVSLFASNGAAKLFEVAAYAVK